MADQKPKPAPGAIPKVVKDIFSGTMGKMVLVYIMYRKL